MSFAAVAVSVCSDQRNKYPSSMVNIQQWQNIGCEVCCTNSQDTMHSCRMAVMDLQRCSKSVHRGQGRIPLLTKKHRGTLIDLINCRLAISFLREDGILMELVHFTLSV